MTEELTEISTDLEKRLTEDEAIERATRNEESADADVVALWTTAETWEELMRDTESSADEEAVLQVEEHVESATAKELTPMSQLASRLPEWLRTAECEPSFDPLLAYHEAGHVVAQAALGLPTDSANIATFRLGRRLRVGPSSGGIRGWPEVEGVVLVAGNCGEMVFREQPGRMVWGGTFIMTDCEAFYALAKRVDSDTWTWTETAFECAYGILEANDAVLRAVAERVLVDQWVNGDVLKTLTACVARVDAPEIPQL